MRESREEEEEERERRHEPQPGCAEGAGQAAANCAAVCCCCPLMLLDVLLLVTVKLPAGIMRRLRRRQRPGTRRRHGKRGKKRHPESAAEPASPSWSGKAMIAAASPPLGIEEAVSMGTWHEVDPAASELEREIMSSRLYGAGFWRSVSSGSTSSRHQ